MTLPGRVAIFAAMLLAIALLGAAFAPAIAPAVLAVDVLLLVAVFLEGRALKNYQVVVSREEKKRLEINRESDFVYVFENRGERDVIVSLVQPWPDAIEAPDRNMEVRAAPGEIVRASLKGTPIKRGVVKIPPAEVGVRFASELAKSSRILPEARAAVYPDLTAIAQYERLRRAHALTRIGVHKRRLIGMGREFELLREYLPDDDYRDINWKATARRRRPITNVYQVERSQDVLLCLDCGRMMGNPVGSGSALDRAVDASLMLAHVSHRQGDRVGLMTVKDTVELYIKPKSQSTAVTRIIEELVDVRHEDVFPSYTAMSAALRSKHNRRSLIFLFTDLNDPQLARNLMDVSPGLSRRHIFVVVSLRDPLLDKAAASGATTRDDIYRTLAARKLASERDAISNELRKAGVRVLETDADSISLEAVNAYLEIKARQLV